MIDANPTALSTDERFLRGGRIAEKIQEYYHQNQAVQKQSAGLIKNLAPNKKKIIQAKGAVAVNNGNIRLVNSQKQTAATSVGWQNDSNRIKTSQGNTA